MKYYLQVKDNIIISHSNLPVENIDTYNIDINQDIYNEYIDTPERFYVKDNNVIMMDDTQWEEYLNQKEKERISHLKCTKRVLALMLQQMGISYTRLKNLIATNEQAQLEWDLCIELERCNPLLDIMGQQLGLSPQQIDIMFKYANGEVDTLN